MLISRLFVRIRTTIRSCQSVNYHWFHYKYSQLLLSVWKHYCKSFAPTLTPLRYEKLTVVVPVARSSSSLIAHHTRLQSSPRESRFSRSFPLIALAFLYTVQCEDIICDCSSCKKRALDKHNNNYVHSNNCPSKSNSSKPNTSSKQSAKAVVAPPPPPPIELELQETANISNYESKPPVTDWLEPDEMTNGLLIKQACILTVDSVTRILSLVVNAVEEYHSQYRTVLNGMIALLEECRLCSAQQLELLECKMVILRSQLEEMNKHIIALETYIASVERLALAAAETTYLGNAEYHSGAMIERLDSVLFTARRIKEETKSLERDMLELQSIMIVESGKSLK